MSGDASFGPGFHREVEALNSIWDRGVLYAHEYRENLRKLGVVILDEVPTPDIEAPQPDYGDDQDTREAA